jgi:hypothetical protein
MFGDFWTSSVWNSVAAIGQCVGAAATFAALAYIIWGDKFKSPLLLVSFDPSSDILTQGNTPGIPVSTLSRWLRVRVENKKGRRTAKNCRGYVTSVLRPDGENAYTELLPADSRQLYWRHDPMTERPLPKDLLPGVPNWLDLVGTCQMNSAWKICCCPDCVVHGPARCVITVLVSANKSAPVSITIQVTSNPTWDKLTGEVAPDPRLNPNAKITALE